MADKVSLKNIVGEELLNKVQDCYLKYLGSSARIYEVNGDCAAALFSSKYCDFLNRVSRKMAGKTDEEALKSVKWICREDCGATSLESIKNKKPCEMECSCGIKIYAAPIIAEGIVIGSNNAGVSNPPTDEKKINEIAQKYKVNPKELLKIAKEHIPRPEYLLNAARNHILVGADTIAEIFLRKRVEEEIIVANNITERKKTEQELKEAYQKLKETQEELIQSAKMATMGQIAAGISHELAQPLTGIKGFAQAVLMNLDKKSHVREDLKKVVEQANRMDTIIKNVRFFARKADFKMQELDINQPIKDSLMLLRQQLKVHNIQLKIFSDENLPRVKGDPNQLEQAFLNLVVNARDALAQSKSRKRRELVVKTSLS